MRDRNPIAGRLKLLVLTSLSPADRQGWLSPLKRCDRFLYYSGMTCIVAVPGTGPGIGTGAGVAP